MGEFGGGPSITANPGDPASLPQKPELDKRSVLPGGKWLLTTGLKNGLFQGVEIVNTGAERYKDGPNKGQEIDDVTDPNKFHSHDRITSVTAVVDGTPRTMTFEDSFPVMHLTRLQEFIKQLPKGTKLSFTVERKDGTTKDAETNQDVPKYKSVTFDITPVDGNDDIFLPRSKVKYFSATNGTTETAPSTIGGKEVIPTNLTADKLIGNVDKLTGSVNQSWNASGAALKLEAKNGTALRITSYAPLFSHLYQSSGGAAYAAFTAPPPPAMAIYQIGKSRLTKGDLKEVDRNLTNEVLEFLKDPTLGEYLPIYVLLPRGGHGKDINFASKMTGGMETKVLFLKRSDLMELGAKK